MPLEEELSDYESLKNVRASDRSDFRSEDRDGFVRNRPKTNSETGDELSWPARRPVRALLRFGKEGDPSKEASRESQVSTSSSPTATAIPAQLLKQGHGLTFIAVFLFTLILYARPSEFYPSALTASIAFIVGITTLAIFVPSQLAVEGNLTARPPEVNYVLLLAITGLLSIPLAIDPAEAWGTFSDTFIRCIVVFIVMVNVLRTKARLKALLLLAIAVSIWLSVGAINDYRLGLTTVEGYRVGGRGSGIFSNSNDMALHLVTIVPIALASFFGSRLIGKILYGAAAMLIMAAIVLTYSRGAFLALITILSFIAWKMAGRQRFAITFTALLILTAFMIFAPGNYFRRLASIFIPSLDPVGSADMRRAVLIRSLWTAIRHPLFGVGMGNFHYVSFRELVSHNAYTQVAAEMGLAAGVFYTMFLVTPLRRLGQVARETLQSSTKSNFYYLAIGLQGSLIAYMVASFFASVAYLWYPYYLVAYAVCLRRLYESETGKLVVVENRKARRKLAAATKPSSAVAG